MVYKVGTWCVDEQTWNLFGQLAFLLRELEGFFKYGNEMGQWVKVIT